MSEGCRPATTADAAAMLAVAEDIAPELAEARGGRLFLQREAVAEADRIRVAIEGGTAFVGTYDDVVLGYATFAIEDLSDGTRLGRIESLVVDPTARKSGIGESLMNALLAELRRRGCASVDAHALPGDRDTKNFFESFGLKARLLVVNRVLEDGTT